MPLVDLVQRRLIIVTGKGGVGKTTLAASLARAHASRGKRVLLAEIVPDADTPSALWEVLGGPKPKEEPVLTADHLWTVLLTPTMGHRRFLQDTLPVKVLADAAMRSSGLRKFLTAAPGFSDMGIMYRMLDLMRREHPGGGHAYEVCIVDSPATGHALALAQIPEFLTRVIPGGPIYRAAQAGIDILTDKSITGTIIVTLPETLPVTEALDLRKGLEKHRLPVSAVVVNRIPRNPFSEEERAALEDVLPSAEKSVYGTRELKRIERAEAAVELLREKSQGDYVTLPDVEGVGAEAVKHLAGHL